MISNLLKGVILLYIAKSQNGDSKIILLVF